MKTFLDTRNHPHELPEGKTVHWRIAGHAFVVNDSDEILVIVPTHRPQYDLPGGRVELDESIPEGVARECYEETGYRVALGSQIPFFVSETNFYSTNYHKRSYDVIEYFVSRHR